MYVFFSLLFKYYCASPFFLSLVLLYLLPIRGDGSCLFQCVCLSVTVTVSVSVSLLACSMLYYRPEYRISGLCYAHKIGQCCFSCVLFRCFALAWMEFTLYERIGISRLRSVGGIPGNDDKKSITYSFHCCVTQIHNRHNFHNHIRHHTSNPTSIHLSNSL